MEKILKMVINNNFREVAGGTIDFETSLTLKTISLIEKKLKEDFGLKELKIYQDYRKSQLRIIVSFKPKNIWFIPKFVWIKLYINNIDYPNNNFIEMRPHNWSIRKLVKVFEKLFERKMNKKFPEYLISANKNNIKVDIKGALSYLNLSYIKSIKLAPNVTDSDRTRCYLKLKF